MRAPDRGSAVPVLLGGLALVALGAIILLVYNLRDDSPRRKPAKIVVAGDPPAARFEPGATPEASPAPPPEIHPRDPNVADPNGDFRTVYQHEHTDITDGQWNKIESLLKRKLDPSEKVRVDKLVNGWQEDLETYERARAEGRWDANEYTRRSNQLTEAMRKRFREMFNMQRPDADQMLLLFQ